MKSFLYIFGALCLLGTVASKPVDDPPADPSSADSTNSTPEEIQPPAEASGAPLGSLPSESAGSAGASESSPLANNDAGPVGNIEQLAAPAAAGDSQDSGAAGNESSASMPSSGDAVSPAPADEISPVPGKKNQYKSSAALLEEQVHGSGNLSLAQDVNRIEEPHENPEIELHVELVQPYHTLEDLENSPDELREELEVLLSSIVENFARSLKGAVKVPQPGAEAGSRSISPEENVNNAIKEVLESKMEEILRKTFDIASNPRLRDIANSVIDDIFGSRKSRS